MEITKEEFIKLLKDYTFVDSFIKKAVEANDGYCPCMIERSEKTKCICEEFLNQESGFCRCGRYVKIEG